MKVRALLLAVLSFGLLSVKAEKVYFLKEGNSFQSFVLAENEVYVEPKAFTSFRLLQKRLTEYWPEAVLLEECDNAALVKLPPTQMLETVLKDSNLKQKLGRAKLLPVLYFKKAKGVRGAEKRRIVTDKVLIKAVDERTAKQLSRQFGGSAFASTSLKNRWMLYYANALNGLEQVERMRKQGVEAHVMLAKEMSRRFVPNDKFYSSQWHLKVPLTGSISFPPKLTYYVDTTTLLDINVESAWDSVTGNGVTIAIVDDGLQTKHPDLKAHVATKFEGLHLNLNGGRLDNPRPKKSRNYHGTACAGMAAAVGNNRKGVVGVAFNAKLAGIRLIAREFTDEQAAQALSWQKDKISIYSNSWGPEDSGQYLDDALPGELTVNALQQGVETGRGGLGSLFFWAAGNGRSNGDHSNYDGYANSRYVIAVGAYNSGGNQAYYSESGANLVIVAPSDGGIPVFTTDLRGKRGDRRRSYTFFGGTSAAAPQAAGLAALMLERNPDLGWRDVKEILIRTANRQGLAATNDIGIVATDGNEKFSTNGAGWVFSHSYGAGRLDATAAVNLAATWTNLGAEEASPLLSYSNLNLGFDQTNDAVKTFLFTTNTNDINPATAFINLRVETVVFTVDVRGVIRSNLVFELTSPSGMKTVVPSRIHDSELGLKEWTFSSVRHWGESSEGVWTLRAKNSATNMITISENDFGELEANKAEVVSMGLQIFGTKIE